MMVKEKLKKKSKKIPKRITMFMCPGQHDSVRVAEPQPIIDSYYGKTLHEISNLVLTTNPARINLIENEKEKAIVFQFGEAVRPDIPVGFHFKLPIIQTVKKKQKKYIIRKYWRWYKQN